MMKLLRLFLATALLLVMTNSAFTQENPDRNRDTATNQSDEDDHDDHDHDNHEEEHGEHGEEEHDDHDEDHGEHNEEEHGDHADHDDHEEHGDVGSAELSPQQLSIADIKVAELQAQSLNYQVYTPGEIKANGYTSYVVSPRVDSVVLRRHVALGDHVEKDQALVTLFSETVAEAQAMFQVASAEWQRVKQLGRTAVGDKRFVTAESDLQVAKARLIAFGLSEKSINTLGTASQSIGEYTLTAISEGVVRSDDFHQGQRVEAGQLLMDLVDEHELWVEARLSPTNQFELPLGAGAVVTVGDFQFNATVAQEAHTIDPQTRTRVVRLLIHNEDHRLHPGLFADVFFSFATEMPVLAVPEAALMRSADGDWVVFVETTPGEFAPQEVELKRSLGQWREISGITEGSRVVVQGAFFVASQIAKGGFDPHNH